MTAGGADGVRPARISSAARASRRRVFAAIKGGLDPLHLQHSHAEEVSAAPAQIAALLRDHCERLEAQAGDDPELEEAGLVEAWRELARMPETQPDGSQRAAMSSLAGMVKIVLNQLHQHGMVQSFDTGEGETYTPTPRYRMQVRELAANELFERCAAVLPGFLEYEDR